MNPFALPDAEAVLARWQGPTRTHVESWSDDEPAPVQKAQKAQKALQKAPREPRMTRTVRALDILLHAGPGGPADVARYAGEPAHGGHWQKALSRLVAAGKAERRVVDGRVLYAIKR